MIEITQDGALWTLMLNRPDKANALTLAMLQTLDDAVAAATTARAQVLILIGAGKVFSAGADLEAARAGLATHPVWERLSTRIAAFPGLSIAALNGTIAGGAMGMALACDLRLAVPGAALFYPVMKLGFLPQPSDPTRLAALAGASRAKLLLMSGARVSVEEAAGWGLIDRIVDADRLLPEAAALAAPALGASPDHVAAIKGLLR